MAMSRKTYVAVAKAIADARTRWADEKLSGDTDHSAAMVTGALDDVAVSLAAVFAADNPAFDHTRFYGAAGVK